MDIEFERLVLELERVEGVEDQYVYRARVGSVWQSVGSLDALWLEAFDQGSSGSTRDLSSSGEDLPAEKTLAEVGKALFDWAFVGVVKERFLEAFTRAEAPEKGLTLCVQLDNAPELASLPWEALRDPRNNGFLGRSPRVVIVRTLGRSAGPAPFVTKSPLKVSPLKVWALLPDPPGLPKISGMKEWRKVREHLDPLEKQGILHLDECRPPTLETLGRRLEKEPCDVLHVVAHGSPSRVPEEMGRLDLESPDGGWEVVTGLELVGAMVRQNPPRLVVLNICSSGESRPESLYDGLAQHLLNQGVGAVVAMGSSVSDRSAVIFGESLYEYLAEGASLEAAMSGARQRMALGPDRAEWVKPRLFLAQDHLQLTGSHAFPVPTTWRRWGAFVVGLILLATGWLVVRSGGWNVLPSQDARSSQKGGPGERCRPPAALPDLRMVYIPAGLLDVDGVDVPVSPGFCIGAYEVTRAQWSAVMEEEPPDGDGDLLPDTAPVTHVTYADAERFMGALNLGQEGPYRLPSEIEWEYAARAGASTQYSFGDDASELDQHGNCRNKFGRDTYDGTAPVGSYLPNAWGLYDVHGNVAEWVRSTGFMELDAEKARRMGGSFANVPRNCSFDASPSWVKREDRSREETGFRVLRELTTDGPQKDS